MQQTSAEKQVPTELYESFLRYSDSERWVSYYCQIEEVLTGGFSSLLEIGVGNKVLKTLVETQSKIKYQSLDIDPDLKPDVVGSVTSIPLPNNSVDAICAFQILEHIPFEDFEPALQEMARVARKKVLISLPHFGPPLKLKIKVPFIPEIAIAYKLPVPMKHVFNGAHYWEIGKRGYSPRRIRRILSQYFTIEKEYVPFDSQYHRFYILSV